MLATKGAQTAPPCVIMCGVPPTSPRTPRTLGPRLRVSPPSRGHSSVIAPRKGAGIGSTKKGPARGGGLGYRLSVLIVGHVRRLPRLNCGGACALFTTLLKDRQQTRV